MSQYPSFDIDALFVFDKVVECRNLSKAALMLGMPKSTVSRKIMRLESDLGLKLLRKSTHQITVTDVGEKIYCHGLNILAEANRIRELVEDSKPEPQGVLRVAIPVFMGTDFASRVAATFLQRYSKSQIEIRLVDTMVHPIKDGFDVVFGTGRLKDSALIARKVFTLECFLCASPAFIKQLPEPITAPAQLNTLPFVDAGIYNEPRSLVLTQAKKRCELTPMVRARANNFQVSKKYILAGLGFGAMPTQIICSDELQHGSIVPILPSWSPEPVDVHIIYPFQLSYSNLINAFYEIACEIISENTQMSTN